MEKKTFEEVARLWQGEKKKYVKRSTFAAYSLLLENHLIPALGHMDDITEAVVQSFVLRKIDGGLSHQSVKDILIVLKMILRYGVKYCNQKPRQIDIVFPTERENNEVQILSLTNQKKMMRHLTRHFSFLNLGILICLCCGLRIGEICALKWNDIDLESKIILITKTIQRIYVPDGENSHTELIIGPPKTKTSIRSVPIADELVEFILNSPQTSDPNHYVLTDSPTPIEPRTYRNHYNRLIRTLGLPKIKFHGLRHSFATRCIESQCDYKTLSAILGHANISTTLNLYVHPNQDQKQRCVEQMLQRLK